MVSFVSDMSLPINRCVRNCQTKISSASSLAISPFKKLKSEVLLNSNQFKLQEQEFTKQSNVFDDEKLFINIFEKIIENILKTGPKLWMLSADNYEQMPTVVGVYYIFFSNFYDLIMYLKKKYGEPYVKINRLQWEIIEITSHDLFKLLYKINDTKTAQSLELIVFFNTIKNCIIVFDEIINLLIETINKTEVRVVLRCDYCHNNIDVWVKCKCAYLLHTHCIWVIVTKTSKDLCPRCSRAFL